MTEGPDPHKNLKWCFIVSEFYDGSWVKSGGGGGGRSHERMGQLVIETFNQETIAINNWKINLYLL